MVFDVAGTYAVVLLGDPTVPSEPVCVPSVELGETLFV